MKHLYVFLTGAFTCLVLDISWLGFLMNDFYKRELAPVVRMENGGFGVILWAASLVYVLIPLGLQLFVLPKKLKSRQERALWGAAFGFVLYGVYETTNYSLLHDWSLSAVWVDWIWGTVLCGLATVAMDQADRKL